MKKFPIVFTEKEELISWCKMHLSKEEKQMIYDKGRLNLSSRALPVYVFDSKGKSLGEFSSVRAAAKELDVSVSAVSAVIKNKGMLYGMFYIRTESILEEVQKKGA